MSHSFAILQRLSGRQLHKLVNHHPNAKAVSAGSFLLQLLDSTSKARRHYYLRRLVEVLKIGDAGKTPRVEPIERGFRVFALEDGMIVHKDIQFRLCCDCHRIYKAEWMGTQELLPDGRWRFTSREFRCPNCGSTACLVPMGRTLKIKKERLGIATKRFRELFIDKEAEMSMEVSMK